MEKLIQQRANRRRQKTPSPDVEYSPDQEWNDNYSPDFNF